MDILLKFNLPSNAHFIQHRNLNEFKYFNIEKINPTHRIFVYGTLKNNNKKKETSKSLIKVGEIIITSIGTIINIKLFYSNIDFICICFSMFFFACFIFYWFANINLLRGIYDNWHRRFFRGWENHLYG
jgi:hypothetical protein